MGVEKFRQCEIYISMEPPKKSYFVPKIKNVIFNNPATIVFWEDGSKTVVKAHNESFDEEKGLAMAITKKALGNKSNYIEYFSRCIKKGLKSVKE